MAYPRGQSKIVMNRHAASIDDMIRIVATPSFFVALTLQETETLLALEGNEPRLAHIYEGAMSLWTDEDFCEIEDTWDPIHRIVNRAEPIETFEWDIGGVPTKYLIMGTSQLLEDCTENELNLMSTEVVAPIAHALARIDEDAFSVGYEKHCPRSWDNFGERDCAFCWDNFVKLRDFYVHQAGTGKNLVFAVEY